LQLADPAPIRAARPNVAEFTVSELSAQIRRTLEQGFGHVRLRGEIAGFRGAHSSGHCYFALKDEKAKIEAVIWRGVFQALRFKPEEGLEVIVTGKVTSYPGSSKYQIVIDALEPAGAGALMVLLEERKKKLAAEGLFAPERKRPLPFLPRVVGIVTSPTGAVIRDMLHGFKERFPTCVVVWPVRVQGETSAREVAAAIRGFNSLPQGGSVPRPDVLIVARGGGSLEDLWGFNEEIVVRAVAESAIPVISAVGHETDWTLIDLVADARAPTPTKAAEWAVPKYSELAERVEELTRRMRHYSRRRLDEMRARLAASARGLPRPADLLALPRQRFDAGQARLTRALIASTRAHAHRLARVSVRLSRRLLAERQHRLRDRLAALRGGADQALVRVTGRQRARLERVSGRIQPGQLVSRAERCRERLTHLKGRARGAHIALLLARRRALEQQGKLLQSLSYQSVLERGFALVRSTDGEMIRRAASIGAGQRLEIELADGRVPVTSDTPGEPKPEPKSKPLLVTASKPRKGKAPPGQGELF
jgi:exodeoxyribonuclease VII large subunit